MVLSTARKQKTFPSLDAPAPSPIPKQPAATSDNDDSGDESDAPEAVTITRGQAVADAKESAIKAHQQRLQEKKKAKNKDREAFIQSTKSKYTPFASANLVVGDSRDQEDDMEEENSNEAEGNPALLARMAKAMMDAQEEDQGLSSDEEMDKPRIEASTSTTRLPDSIFAAAAVAHHKTERKRKPNLRKQDAMVKRRRVREGPSERLVGGRTVRVAAALDAPPPPPSTTTRKSRTSTKGGAAFRKKWKSRDALQAQIRSRSGPAHRFATAVQ